VNEKPYPRPFGSFVLLQLIGRGGMSEVELARQAVSEANFVRFIVIKRIHKRHTGNDEFVRMFQDEARINAELQHENIAQVYAFGRSQDEYYLAMEYVPGLDLRMVLLALMEEGKTLPLRIALRVIHDVLTALGYAHGRVDTYGQSMHIVHRDVNPRNIMLSMRGEVKLIDFGVAKADTKTEQTKEHALKGKFSYMAPEQIDKVDRLDGRADIFALGLVLHELITGERPFAELNEVQTFHRILSGKIPAPQTIPDHPEPQQILDLHQRSLKVDRDERYANAAEMRRAVIAAAEPIGGLPNAEEMSQFLREAVPTEMDTIASRLRHFGKMDLTGYFRRESRSSETLVRATNITETFELKRRRRPKDGISSAPQDEGETAASPISSSEPTSSGGFRSALLAGALLLLVLGYLMVLGTSYVIWDLLQSR
jgi:serine/threonine protein kinase